METVVAQVWPRDERLEIAVPAALHDADGSLTRVAEQDRRRRIGFLRLPGERRQAEQQGGATPPSSRACEATGSVGTGVGRRRGAALS